MAEKVKVNQKEVDALNDLKETHGIEKALKMHADFLKVPEPGWGGSWDFLNKYNLTDFAKLLLSDYEIEQTPEEKLVERFQYCEQRWGWHRDDETEMRATANAIKETLDTLNIEIKGINK